MAISKMLMGSPILMGNNTVPGVKIHKEVRDQLKLIFEEVDNFGLDYYPTYIEFQTYDEISEIASYGGFPVRYPHWRFGMEYEELSRGYEYGMHRISEMVINTNPCVIYCLDSNTLVDNIDVIAHALGHNHFFKNNIFFSATDTSMMDKMANHASRIRRYMARWGKEKVTEFIDHCLRIETLIDSNNAWKSKKINKAVIQDQRTYRHVDRWKHEHNYMDDWINSKERMDEERKRIEKEDLADQMDLFTKPTRDIFGYLKNNAPMKPWQQDIISMLYEESMYFAPQRATKMLNEGFASWVDYKIMCCAGLCAAGQKRHDAGIIEYAKHKMLVLGGKYSQNPYKLGYELLMDIENRWNKGRFGSEYEDCKDMREKKKWDKKLGEGKEKVFEVCKFYNDVTAIAEYFTPEFCEKNEWYEYKHMPNGEWKIVSRDFHSIKRKLMQRYMNGGLPDIRLTDPNHLGKGWFFLQHAWDGRPLYDNYARDTITSVWRLWRNVVVLATKDTQEREYVYVCDGPSHEKDVHIMLRHEYEKEFVK
jgi:stage V sporulation protein R